MSAITRPAYTSPASRFQRLEPLFGGRRGPVAALVIVSVVAGLAEAAILATVAQAAAALVDGARSVHVSLGPVRATTAVGALLGAAVALATIRLVLQVPLSTIPARIASDVQAGMQRQLFSAFTRAAWSEQASDREGHLQELVTNQVLQAAWAALAATGFCTSALTLVILVVSALLLNIVAAVAVLATVCALFILLRPLNNLISRRSRGLSQAQMDMASGVGQAARLAEETHVFGVDAAQEARLGDLVSSVRGLFYRTQMLARFTPGVFQGSIYLLVVGGLAALDALHSGHVASLGAVVLLLIRAGAYGQQAQATYQGIRQALPFVERVQDAKQRYEASIPEPGARALPQIRTLAFSNVDFAYTPHRKALSGVSFSVSAGEAIGVVGPSGAGKSTLVQLLLQLRTPDEGDYLVNGVAAHEYAADEWHSHVAYVPQEPRLIHASVAENIRFYRDLSDEEVAAAARLARVESDILSWRDGYETMIGPRADAVSGGQQQRVCIARALAGRPDVLVLDEPTSALDPSSESLIQASLAGLKSHLTLFVIAHRMSTLNICNRVMVILDGHLVAFDTASNLTRDNAYYRSALGVPARARSFDFTDQPHATATLAKAPMNGSATHLPPKHVWLRRRS